MAHTKDSKQVAPLLVGKVNAPLELGGGAQPLYQLSISSDSRPGGALQVSLHPGCEGLCPTIDSTAISLEDYVYDAAKGHAAAKLKVCCVVKLLVCCVGLSSIFGNAYVCGVLNGCVVV